MARYREWAWLAGLCVLGLLIVPVHADLILPAITHVYFEKNDAPYNDSVQYSVNCYGYTYSYPPITKTAGSYQPELVFHYSASCGGYGCSIYQPYYLKYTHIDRCDLEGNTGNQTFTLTNFSAVPYSRCDRVPYRISRQQEKSREYYYYTPEYSSCQQFGNNQSGTISVDRLNFADTAPANSSQIISLEGSGPLYETQDWSHLTINKTDISMDPDQYIVYLETCDPTTDRKCPGWIINGKPLKTFTEYRTLKTNTTDLKEHPCDTFLVRADPSLIMPFSDDFIWHHQCLDACNYTEEICESRFTIPSGNINATASGNLSSVQDRILAATVTTRNLTDVSQFASTAVRRSPVESLYCAVLEIFGATC